MMERTQSFFLKESNSNDKIRIFCFPYAGGGASAYRNWGTYLPNYVGVYPIQIPGRENRITEKALTDIPVNAGIAAGAIAVIFPSILALSVVAAIATKITIEITKSDGSVEIVNKIVKNAANDIKGKAFGLKEKAFSVANDMKEKRENGKTNENKTNKFHKHNKLENETSFTYTVKFDDVD